MRARLRIAVFTLLAVALLLPAGAASAAREAFVISFNCGTVTGTVTVANNGNFGTGKLDDGRTVIPVQFLGSSGQLFVNDEPAGEFDEPAEPLKGKRHQRQDLLTCNFSFDETFEENGDLVRVVGEGKLTAVIKP